MYPTVLTSGLHLTFHAVRSPQGCKSPSFLPLWLHGDCGPLLPHPQSYLFFLSASHVGSQAFSHSGPMVQGQGKKGRGGEQDLDLTAGPGRASLFTAQLASPSTAPRGIGFGALLCLQAHPPGPLPFPMPPCVYFSRKQGVW